MAAAPLRRNRRSHAADRSVSWRARRWDARSGTRRRGARGPEREDARRALRGGLPDGTRARAGGARADPAPGVGAPARRSRPGLRRRRDAGQRGQHARAAQRPGPARLLRRGGRLPQPRRAHARRVGLRVRAALPALRRTRLGEADPALAARALRAPRDPRELVGDPRALHPAAQRRDERLRASRRRRPRRRRRQPARRRRPPERRVADRCPRDRPLRRPRHAQRHPVEPRARRRPERARQRLHRHRDPGGRLAR